MIKAVIFDVDGVLLDNDRVYVKAYKETGRRLGLKVPSDAEVKKNFGLVWDEILAKLYGEADENMKKLYSEICNSLDHEIRIMDDLEYILQRIEQRKAIAASKSRPALERKLGKLTMFFEVIVTREDTEKHKPEPEPLLLACKKLRIKPEEAVYIGDAVIDCQAARNAGTGFIGFLGGAASKEDFDALKVKSVGSLKELLEVLQ